MSILRDIFGADGQSTGNDPGPWGSGMVRIGGGGSRANWSIDAATQLSAVYACLRLISENVATMPLNTYVNDETDTRRKFRLPDGEDFLSFDPPQQSRIDYLSQVALSLLAAGDAFIATPRTALGVPISLVPLQPDLVAEIKRDDTGREQYQIGGKWYDDRDVLHIKGMCMPGALRGMSPLSAARKAVELGLSAQAFGEWFFNNGALPAGVIEAPGQFPKSASDRIASLWNRNHRGVSNAGKVGVLTGGAKFVKVTIAPEEAQFLQTRQFQIPEIARFFGVPPHLIADASNSTSWGSGLEEQNLAFGQLSLRPWVKRIEEQHDRLLTTAGYPEVFCKLNMDALGRAGTKERYDAYGVALANGFLTINEVRALEDLPPVAWGDKPLGQSGEAPPITGEDVRLKVLAGGGNAL